MLYIKDIFKACVCSFCENIYEYYSIDEEDFIKYFKMFCTEEDLQSCLEFCTSDITYDIGDIDNVCNNLRVLSHRNFEINDVIDNCIKAYKNTIERDKTINIEAFVDNLYKEFRKIVL